MGRRLSAHGITIDIPDGWNAEIYQRPEAGAQPVAHLANFPLPPRPGDFGSGVVETMRSPHVFVALNCLGNVAQGGEVCASSSPGALAPDDFRSNRLQRALSGQAGCQRFFNRGGRAWALYVVLGRIEDRTWLTPVANLAVGAISVD